MTLLGKEGPPGSTVGEYLLENTPNNRIELRPDISLTFMVNWFLAQVARTMKWGGREGKRVFLASGAGTTGHPPAKE